MEGSLPLPCSKFMMLPCRFAEHWEVFPGGRGLLPTGKGQDLWRAVALPGSSHFFPAQLCCQGSQGTFTCPEKGPRGAQCVTPLPSSLTAPSWLYLQGEVAPAPPGVISGEQMGLIHGPALGRAPCHPYQWGSSRPGAEGSQSQSCCAGARAGDIVTAPP